MTVETKYYCDECGKGINRGVSIAVIVVEGFYEMPRSFDRSDDFVKLGRIPYEHRTVYNKLLCYDCIGEEVQHHWGGEGKRDFKLLEGARQFLIRHRFLKPFWRALCR